MKKLVLSLIVVVLTTVAKADTNQVSSFFSNAINSSNITGVVYGTYFNKAHAYGGGFLALYNLGDYVSAGLGSDYAGEWRQFSGTVTAHYKFNLVADKLSLTCYGIAAAGTSLGGAGTDNGGLATGEGGGSHFNYRINDKWSAGMGVGYIQRQGCGNFSGGSEIVTASVGWSF